MNIKFLNIVLFLLCIQNILIGQLIENKDGDMQITPFIDANSSKFALIKINTGDQSIGAEYFSNNLKDKYYSIRVKAKSTEGIGSVFSSGSFSPGVNLGTTYTKVALFDDANKKVKENKFLDWGTLFVNYSVNRYKLYKQDTLFKDQIYTRNFKGLACGAIYNVLFNNKNLFSISISYERANNFNELKKKLIQDVFTEIDVQTQTSRNIVIENETREGDYIEGDAFPLKMSFTKLIEYENIEGLGPGFSFYFNSKPQNKHKPISNIGVVLYLAKKKDINQIPVLGLNFQINDVFDVKGLNNGILNRFSVGITSNFTFI